MVSSFTMTAMAMERYSLKIRCDKKIHLYLIGYFPFDDLTPWRPTTLATTCYLHLPRIDLNNDDFSWTDVAGEKSRSYWRFCLITGI